MNASQRPAPALRLLSNPAANEQSDAMVRELERALVDAYGLTGTQREVLRGLVSGTSDEAIGRALGMRTTSVHKHMHRVFARTQTEGRQALIKLGFRLAARRRIFAPSLMAA